MAMNAEMQQMEADYQQWFQQAIVANKGMGKGSPYYLGKGGYLERNAPYAGGMHENDGGGGGIGGVADGGGGGGRPSGCNGKGKGGLFGPNPPIAQEFNFCLLSYYPLLSQTTIFLQGTRTPKTYLVTTSKLIVQQNQKVIFDSQSGIGSAATMHRQTKLCMWLRWTPPLAQPRKSLELSQFTMHGEQNTSVHRRIIAIPLVSVRLPNTLASLAKPIQRGK